MKRLGKFLLYLFFSFVAVLLVVQIPKVNTKITQTILNAALPKNMYAELSQIRGEFPFDIIVDTIKVYDKTGEWLVVNKFKFSWLAANVFFGKIDIEKVGAEKVELIRFPEMSSSKSATKNGFFFPILIEEYFINQVKISPWYSGSLKIHGDASLIKEDQASLALFVETIDQQEHGDVDLLELKVHTNGNKLIVFAEAKDSLSRLQTVVPEFVSKNNQGDYEFNIDLEANLDGTDVTGVCAGAINNFTSTDVKLNQFIGNQLDWHIDVNLDKTGENIIGKGELSTSTHIKADWNLNYYVANKEYTSTLKLNLPRIEKLLPDIEGVHGNVNIFVNAEGLLTDEHRVKWVITGPVVFENEVRKLSGNVFYKNQIGNFYMDLIHSSLQTSLHGDFNFRDNLFHFNNLDLKGTGHKVSGNLSLHQDTLFPHEMDFTVSINDARPVAKLFGQEARGSLEGTIHKKKDQYDINLKADHPDFQNISFQTITSKISFQNFENFAMDIKADTGYYKRSIIDSLTFKAHSTHGKGQFEGHFHAPETQALTTGSLNVSPHDWKILVQKLQVFHDKQLAVGLFNPLHVDVTQDTVKVTANKLKLHTGELLFTNLEFGKTPSGKVSLVNVTPKVLSFLTDELEFSGKIKGEVQFSSLDGHTKVSGRLSLTDFTLIDSSRKTQKLASLNTHITYQDQKWLLKADYRDSASSRLDAQATVLTPTLIPDHTARILARAKGVMDLSIFNTFIWWGDRFKGQLKVDLNIEKTLNQLQHRGIFTLSEGEYENAEFGTILRHIELAAHLKGSVLQITKFSGTDFRDGTFSGSGTLQLADLTAIQPRASLKLDKMLVANDDILSLNASGNIEVRPTGNGAFVVGGQVTTNFVNVFLEDTVQKIKNINTVEITEQSSLRQKKLKPKSKLPVASRYDLKVQIPEKLLIEGRGIKSLWKGDLHIVGALNAPEIQGGLEVVRGRVDMMGKKMTINPYSKITFVNQNGEVEPFLDIKVEKNIREVEVMIWVHGTATDSRIDFISMPPMSQEEIVSLLLFGKPLNSVSSAQSLQLATKLAAIKAGGKGGNIIDQFQKAFGLDELSIGSNDSLDDNEQQGVSSGYSVRVGKQLNDKVYFGVNQNLGGAESDTKAIVDIDITKDTKINLEAGSKGGTIGYFWEKRY